jgi:hypothetical protein
MNRTGNQQICARQVTAAGPCLLRCNQIKALTEDFMAKN